MGVDGESTESIVAVGGVEEVTINIRCTNGSKFSVRTSLGSTVDGFKELLAQNFDVPANQQRLIYKGRILKGDQTLGSYDQTIEIEEERLKYLEFVQAAALCTLIYASKVYDYAKENSGPLKSSVQTVEGTVKTVVGHVYEKYHDVPVELLKFVDRKLAARIVVSNLHKNTKKSFFETIKDMYNHFNQRSGLKAPLIADDVYELIMENATLLDREIIYDRDFDYDYFGFKTL